MSSKGTMGSRIKEKRKHLKLTQEKLAERLEITAALLSQYENDKIDIKASVLIQLAGALSTTVGYLADGEPELSPDEADIVKAYEAIGIPVLKKVALEQMQSFGIINKEGIKNLSPA